MSGDSTAGNLHRRQILKGTACAAAATWTLGAARAKGTSQSAVVFLSRSGNTQVLAAALSRRFGADLVQVRPRDPWPEDYDEMVAWAEGWRRRSGPMPLDGNPDMSPYSAVFLGFPFWGMTLPAPMRSFLRGHDLSGKTVLPFITYGGYGAGDAIEQVRALSSGARITAPLILRCDQERSTLNTLGDWLQTVNSDLPPE